jgi:hypothetical protein
MNKPVFAEVSEDWKYIEIFFQYDPDIVSMMHSCHAQFIEKTAKANPFWPIRSAATRSPSEMRSSNGGRRR